MLRTFIVRVGLSPGDEKSKPQSTPPKEDNTIRRGREKGKTGGRENNPIPM